MKTAIRVTMTLLLLAMFAGYAQAQDAAAKKAAKESGQSVTPAPGKFTDADKNGVCDNRETKGAGAPGKNFVDKNGDGKCDNCGNTGNCKGSGNCCGKGPGKGTGCGNGHQHRHGCGSAAGTTSPPKK